MTLFINQFKKEISFQNPLYVYYSEDRKEWSFNQKIADENSSYFERMIKNYRALEFQHRAFSHYLLTEEKTHLITDDELTSALMLTELLIQLNIRLDIPREIIRLTTLQKKLRSLMQEKGFIFHNDILIPQKTDKLSQKIRTSTAKSNWYRQFILRFIRLLSAIEKVTTSSKYANFVHDMNNFTGPILSYFSWIFYLPRLTVSGLIFFIHLLPIAMNDQEKQIKTSVRLAAYWQRHWGDVANDLIWFIAAVLSCFLWVGRLAPIGAYINFILYGYDVAVALTRAFCEIPTLLAIKSKIKKQLNYLEESGASVEDIRKERAYLESINKLANFEIARLVSNVVSASLLFLAFALCLPVFTNPLIPLTGAVALVVITLGIFVQNKLFAKKPAANLSKLSLFKPAKCTKAHIAPDLHPLAGNMPVHSS